MIKKAQYKLLRRLRYFNGYGYRGLKKILRVYSYYHHNMDIKLVARKTLLTMKLPLKDLDVKNIEEYKSKWHRLAAAVPLSFMKIYSAFTGVESPDFVPSPIFYNVIEPILNNYTYSISFADKNMYAKLIDKSLLPEVVLRKVHGQYLDQYYKHVDDVNGKIQDLITGNDTKFILKPAIASRGGKKIYLLSCKEGKMYSKDQMVDKAWLEKNMGDNFLLQNFVQQHSSYARFNPSSLNTMRVYTYRSVKDERIHVLHAMLRVGKEGAVVDNMSGGGKAIGITEEGEFKRFANSSAGEIFSQVRGIDLSKGLEVYKYDEVREKAKEVAATQLYSRFLGFDFCVDENGEVKLIEINNIDIGVESIQRSNGPLFREFTDEVIDYCEKHKKGLRYTIH